MNRHFKDAWYYLKRAGQEGRLGVTETVSPLEKDLRTRLRMRSVETESERTRGERLKAEFETYRGRAKRMYHRAQARM
ncbi:hypothetical protein [Halocatena pleomorpha]|uniref:Uncharacterized protein n=1 Tax=Halocatena pleomorpha TaxID=1785090 RepID=A0A3P3RAM8_9EURY|nr:hypothetical protein [Halocatena pleomorpha]RRJ30542.1 hypothetical protein EIK79_09690 [Halocatena pleomorpha]